MGAPSPAAAPRQARDQATAQRGRAAGHRRASREPPGSRWVRGRIGGIVTRRTLPSPLPRARASQSTSLGRFVAAAAPAADLLLGALGIELQKPREHLVANLVRPAVADTASSGCPIPPRRSRSRGGTRSRSKCRSSRSCRGRHGPWRHAARGASGSAGRARRGRGSGCRSWSAPRRSGPSARRGTRSRPRQRHRGQSQGLSSLREGEGLEAVRRASTEGHPQVTTS